MAVCFWNSPALGPLFYRNNFKLLAFLVCKLGPNQQGPLPVDNKESVGGVRTDRFGKMDSGGLLLGDLSCFFACPSFFLFSPFLPSELLEYGIDHIVHHQTKMNIAGEGEITPHFGF
jgi:hypothetical protein